jgi:hypothetical protein
VAHPRALRIRYAGPVTPVNTGTGAIIRTVRFTSLSVLQGRGPDRGAAPSIAKPIAALAIVRATTLRHVLGPGSRRIILREAPVEWRTPEPRTWLIHFGERRGVLRRRRGHRGQRRRGRNLGLRRRYRRIWVRMLDAASPRRFVARTGSKASKAHQCSERNEGDSPTRPIHLRPHGHLHDGFLPPGPPRRKILSHNSDRS